MRTILYLIRKEFLQIFRDKLLGKAIFAVPIVQMLILVPAVTFEIKSTNLCVIDRDMSPASRALVTQLEGSTFFRIPYQVFSEAEADDLLHRNRVGMVLQIPDDFGKELAMGKPVKVMVAANAIDAMSAQLSWAYLNSVLRDHNAGIIADQTGGTPLPAIGISNRYWYNEDLNYNFFMLPGILGILVTAIAFLMAGLNLVKEKEMGTIEQINVTPVRKHQFIIAKMVPFLIIGLVDLALGLVIGRLVFRIPFEGSLSLLFLGSAIFMVAALGLALFISSFSGTQQQFMFVAFFFMIIFILMSGIFTPVESMPDWARFVDRANPVVYLMRINRMVMLKGSTFQDISREIYSLIAISLIFTTLAVNRYRKTA